MRIPVGASHEEGFTLVEAVVASFVVLVLISGFAKSMGAAFEGEVENSKTQEATAIAVEQLEFARAMEWADIAMTHIATDAPMINEDTGYLDGGAVELDHDEELIVFQEGLIVPEAVQQVDGTSYTIWSYVTDAGDGLRRLTLLIQWEVEGVWQSYLTSTLISEVSTR